MSTTMPMTNDQAYGEDGTKPLVSIVVPTYNRRESLRRMLDSLRQQTYPMNRFEVVVVDDGSTDGTVDGLRNFGSPYSLHVLQQAHGGPARARNHGVASAHGTLIVFLDDDVEPSPELIDEHVAAHQGDADVVVIGPMLPPPPEWRSPPWLRWHERTLMDQYRAMEAGQWECTWRQFYTANVSIPRAGFMEAGGFDTTFLRSEDTDLADRLSRSGVRFVFNPRAGIQHYAEHSFEKWAHSAYQYGQYEVLMARDKGLAALEMSARDFHVRHPLTRWLTMTCVGRRGRPRCAGLVLKVVMQVTDRLGFDRPAMLAAGGVFSLKYWQGVCDELGGRRAWLDLLAGYRPNS